MKIKLQADERGQAGEDFRQGLCTHDPGRHSEEGQQSGEAKRYVFEVAHGHAEFLTGAWICNFSESLPSTEFSSSSPPFWCT